MASPRKTENRTALDPSNAGGSSCPLAHHAAHFFAIADYSAIRKYENPECILWFCDTSKNNSRRWCSTEACGNRAKVAAFRERT